MDRLLPKLKNLHLFSKMTTNLIILFFTKYLNKNNPKYSNIVVILFSIFEF
jgi:hypothetical protein